MVLLKASNEGYDLLPLEEILWNHNFVQGFLTKETVEQWLITNIRAMKRFPVSSKNNSNLQLANYVHHYVSETIVLNQRRVSHSQRVGFFSGVHIGSVFVGNSSGSSNSLSMTIGDVVFLVNGSEIFRFAGITDPNGVNRLLKALKKQSKTFPPPPPHTLYDINGYEITN